MTNRFQEQLNRELLLSERRRTLIIAALFIFDVVYRAVALLFFIEDEMTLKIQTGPTLWIFQFGVITFELLSLAFINRRIRNNKKKIPLFFQIIHISVETSLPTLIMITVASRYPDFDVLSSPAQYIYFIFIILSTLRLNFLLSFLCGLLASLSYLSISYFIYDHINVNDCARAMVLCVSGIAAGLVGKQIRTGIDNSAREAERRQRVENLFGQQLSPEVAERMLENDGNIETGRMKVAIMFIDIRNFTNFAVGKTPEEIVQYQNAFFKTVIQTVSTYNGIIHQFLGDGCMIIFGAPLGLKNPSLNAVEAGKALLSSIESAQANGEIPSTRIGIGIHSGEVVTGNIGTVERQQYSITGSVVILASRIEQLNKQYGSQLLVSGDVVDSIGHTAISSTCIDTVALRGWHEPMAIYRIA